MKNLPVVPLRFCSYNKEHRKLILSSEFFAGGFPRRFVVESHHTGRKVEFYPIGEGDRLFDMDMWDGEMAIYRPVQYDTRVDHLVITHEY